MTIVDSIILGIIEGVTEFLPISSTGHLIVASEFLNLEQTAVNKAYEVIIQFAAILAVILNYPDKFTFKHIELWKKSPWHLSQLVQWASYLPLILNHCLVFLS